MPRGKISTGSVSGQYHEYGQEVTAPNAYQYQTGYVGAGSYTDIKLRFGH
jgi:hypothetical protein